MNDLIVQLWEAIGGHVAEICRGDANLAPPDYLVDAMKSVENEIERLRAERDDARRTAEHWKAEHIAGNREIDALRAKLASVMLRLQAIEGDINAALRGVGDAINDSDPRPCTCHPDDRPPVPCPGKFSLTECWNEALRALLADIRAEGRITGDIAVRLIAAMAESEGKR
jgi:chromosome segregation ATPase